MVFSSGSSLRASETSSQAKPSFSKHLAHEPNFEPSLGSTHPYTESEPFNPPQHTSALLNQILNPEKDINEQDIIDWGHCLVAGGQSFQDFANKGIILEWLRNSHGRVIFRMVYIF